MDFTVVDPNTLKNDPGQQGALDATGQLCIKPAAFYSAFSKEEIAAFAVRNGFYGIPTEELIDRLRILIGTRSALEIGAGNGVMAKALGIRATDNLMQTWPDIKDLYTSLRQAVVPYGTNVECLDALEAVRRYRPQVVIASWVTHKYDPQAHERGGNMYGVDEEALLAGCESYIHIGNSHVHQHKKIRSVPHRRYRPRWLISRASRPELDEICIWGTRLDGEPPA